MCVAKGAAYLDWKYRRCPHRRYDVVEARRAGELTGFAVTRLDDHRGLRLGWIVDLFADASDHGTKHALLERVLEDFRTAGVARAQCYTMNARLASELRRFGFFPGSTAVQFCIKFHADPGGAMQRREDWNLMLGDGDLDR
jgi:hypothetical protein